MGFRKQFRKYAKKGVRRYVRPAGKGKAKVNYGKIARDLSYVKSVLNTEHKSAQLTIGNSGNIGKLNPNLTNPILQDMFHLHSGNWLAKGTNSDNRVGDKIRVTSITNSMKVVFRNVDNATSMSNCKIYLLYFYDAQKTPTVSDILEHDADGHYTQDSMWNRQYSSNYKIIRRYSFRQPPNTASIANNTPSLDVKLHKKDHFRFSFRPQWDGNTLIKGRIWMLVLADQPHTSDNCDVHMTQKINYVDN